MIKRVSSVLFLFFIVVLLSGCGNSPVTTSNRPPIITKLVAVPTTVYEGQTVSLYCNAYDPDNDTLVYSWVTAKGTIISSNGGLLTTWEAPTNGTEDCQISLIVCDGVNYTGSEIIVHVLIPSETITVMSILEK